MFTNILKKLLPTKRIIAIVGSLAIGAAGVVLGMESKDVREAICGAPILEIEK